MYILQRYSAPTAQSPLIQTCKSGEESRGGEIVQMMISSTYIQVALLPGPWSIPLSMGYHTISHESTAYSKPLYDYFSVGRIVYAADTKSHIPRVQPRQALNRILWQWRLSQGCSLVSDKSFLIALKVLCTPCCILASGETTGMLELVFVRPVSLWICAFTLARKYITSYIQICLGQESSLSPCFNSGEGTSRGRIIPVVISVAQILVQGLTVSREISATG